jgi:hypothetical protein
MSGIIDTVGSKSGIVGSDVYPAGHVVSSDYGFYTGADIGKWDSLFTEASTQLRVTITPTSPNKILLVCQGGLSHAGTDSLILYSSWGIVGGSMNLASSTQGLEASNRNTKVSHSMAILVIPSAYGSAITYTPTYSTISGTCYFTEGSANQNITSYALEIKQ